jgi:predicted nuclease of predicted toxin-antitoxin system
MDFLSANDADLEGVPDPEVLAIAAEQDRILVSHDFQTMPRHFGEFLQARGSSPGVFLVQQYSPVGDVIEELVLVWAASDAEEWKNRILNIPLP